MGTLTRFKFSDEFVKQHPVFIETGTGRGAGIKAAQQFGFKYIISVEIEPSIAGAVREKFSSDPRVEVICGDSCYTLSELLCRDFRDCDPVFWLDAHFPGSDVLGLSYDNEPNPRVRLPLFDEIQVIKHYRPNSVVLIDDLRMYVDGPYRSGNLPAGFTGMSAEQRKSAAYALFTLFAKTHDIKTSYDEEGYLWLVPQSCEGPEYIEFDFKTYCEQARQYYEVGDMIAAEGAYHKVIELTNLDIKNGAERVARGEACRFMAAKAHENSNVGTEMDWYYKALMADPLCIEYRCDFVNHCLVPLQMYEVARQEAEKACKIEPDNPAVWQTAANVEREAADEAKADYFVDIALGKGPKNPGSHLIAAQLYADTSRFGHAIKYYKMVLELPNAAHRKSEALLGMGIVYDRMGDGVKALEYIDRAIEVGGGDQTLARWDRAEILLSLGRYEEGWADHDIRFDDKYRGRELAAFGRLGRRFKAPLLRLEDEPCRVHVHPEMGFGDVICMARYLPKLIELGHDVRFEVKSHMLKLMQDSFPGVGVHEFAIDYPGALGLQDFDRHITTMSFPHLFKTTINTVPWSGPYLKADTRLVTEWNEKLGGQYPRVGLCWSAGIRPGLWYTEYGQRKSMHLADLYPLFDSVPATYVSLQAGPERLEGLELLGLTGETPDWSETAALIKALDLVITVDTSVAHLAGAMGKPTWLMMHTGGSWHWMRDIEGALWQYHSPWYPSVRIFRQKKPHEWREVVEQIATDLKMFTMEW